MLFTGLYTVKIFSRGFGRGPRQGQGTLLRQRENLFPARPDLNVNKVLIKHLKYLYALVQIFKINS